MYKFLLAPLSSSPRRLRRTYDQPYALGERGDASETRKEARVAITKVDARAPRPAEHRPARAGQARDHAALRYARGDFRPEYLDLQMDLDAVPATASWRCTRTRWGRTGSPRCTPSRSRMHEKFSKKTAPAK